MNITIVGKNHRVGISKTGKNYDFIEVHFVAPARGVIGQAAQTLTMGPEVFPFESLAPGAYDAQFDNRGNLLSLAPVQAQPAVNK